MTQRDLQDELRAIWEDPLPEEEFRARVAQAIAELDGEELENLRSLIEWFQRRYPTPLDRLRYNRSHRGNRV